MSPKTAAGMAAKAEWQRQSPSMPDWDLIAEAANAHVQEPACTCRYVGWRSVTPCEFHEALELAADHD